MDAIVVRGARAHNLKNIDVTIPRDRLVVVTGLSGSGKSSLAFDTIYAEGQRRYVESLSTYARQFLDLNAKPDVDAIDGLSPAIAIEQRTAGRNPRSTVGTLTEIYDYLRVLFARIGVVVCDVCGKPIQAMSVQQIVDAILALPAGARFTLLAPVDTGARRDLQSVLAELRKQGFARVRLDGEILALDEDLAFDAERQHALEVVVDRLTVKPEARQRITDSVELALARGHGVLRVALVDGPEHTYSERLVCETCGTQVPELEPRLFSFNGPHGACAKCGGLGQIAELDVERIIPDPSLSLAAGAIHPWGARAGSFYLPQLRAVAKHYGESLDTPWKKLPKKFRDVVLYGSGAQELTFKYESDASRFSFKRAFEGVVPILMRRLKETTSESVREQLQEYMSRATCPECQGTRLRREARLVRVGGKTIDQVGALSIGAARGFFAGLALAPREAEIARPLLKEIESRLSFLEAVGLDYLSLDRGSMTLSGGEAQRIRLATQVGSALQGVIYVLDEPSIGLHQRDNARLIATLVRLRDLGNTVLVVEHDEDTIRAADHIVDMGPGAGLHGGRVVATGTADELAASPASITGDYLAGRRRVEVPARRRSGSGEQLVVRGARGNNLKGLDVAFPLGTLTCVTGVSGSGKSTLVNDTLYAALARALSAAREPVAEHERVEGLKHIDKVVDIDQSPIGRTPRSNPATYTGVFALIRELFAGLPESRTRGYGPGRFSFNVKGGRCETCEGDGVLRIEMHFLPDVFVTCDACHGKRYNRDTLEVLYKGKNIAEVLEMSVEEALGLLGPIPAARRKLETLAAVGLGYVTLGQAATTLSGGEAQRVKLARELSRRATGRTLYILDEPTTGLHFHDVERLLHVLHELVEAGNTVVVIEHNLDVIKTADWLIDLGPEGGAGGGTVVGVGTPEQLAQMSGSHTGRFLRRVLVRET